MEMWLELAVLAHADLLYIYIFIYIYIGWREANGTQLYKSQLSDSVTFIHGTYAATYNLPK